MAQKRITYVPTVRTLGDLPNPAAFEVGTAFWVQSERKFYVTDGTTWEEVA